MLRYAYFPGCVAQGACKELHTATTAISQILGIELIELKKAACCGSGTYKEDSQLLEDTVNARNIALAESLNLPLLTHCSTCQGVIGHVDERLKDAQENNPDYLDKVNGFFGEGKLLTVSGNDRSKTYFVGVGGRLWFRGFKSKSNQAINRFKMCFFLWLLLITCSKKSSL
jgi:succinate dehydrogenase / fumarate reductase cytochrome b subunit